MTKTLHFACIMLAKDPITLSKIPDLCRMQRSIGLVTELWSIRMCFFPFVMLLQWVEIELLAVVGGKCGFQPCDTAERRFFRHACLRNPCLLWNLSVHSLPALHYGCIMAIPSLQLQKNTCLTQRSRRFGHGVVVSRTCWGTFQSPMVPCDHCKTTMNSFGDWAFNHGGWKWGCQPFSCLCSQTVTVGEKKRDVLHYNICLFRLRNLNLHSLPVAWCSWELVLYGLSPPVHHGDSFAAKEPLSPLLSPGIIFAHRIQSTAGRIWLWKIWPLCSVPLWCSFDSLTDRCPFKDTRFCRVRQDFIFVKVPDSWPKIKDHLQAEGNECSRHLRWGTAVPTSQSKHFCHRQGTVPVQEQKPALGHISMWLIWNWYCDCRLFGCSGP